VKKMVEDMQRLSASDFQSGQFRRGLRVKPMQGAPGIWEMTWEPADGRATFEFGSTVIEGEVHIVWRRIGGHAIFASP
jgi:hypothetical protein